MDSDRKESRQAIRAMLDAAANAALSDEQARTLMTEAHENAELAFGAWGNEEFTQLVIDVGQLKAACKNAGYSVVGAYTIQEAFKFLDGKNHADVIVCAAHLEDESVFEFLQRLKKIPFTKIRCL